VQSYGPLTQSAPKPPGKPRPFTPLSLTGRRGWFRSRRKLFKKSKVSSNGPSTEWAGYETLTLYASFLIVETTPFFQNVCHRAYKHLQILLQILQNNHHTILLPRHPVQILQQLLLDWYSTGIRLILVWYSYAKCHRRNATRCFQSCFITLVLLAAKEVAFHASIRARGDGWMKSRLFYVYTRAGSGKPIRSDFAFGRGITDNFRIPCHRLHRWFTWLR
jgi:hypothetical protein